MKKTDSFLVVSLFVMITSARSRGNDIYSLAQIKNGINSERVSSNDTRGNNNDRLENIRPGEKNNL